MIPPGLKKSGVETSGYPFPAGNDDSGNRFQNSFDPTSAGVTRWSGGYALVLVLIAPGASGRPERSAPRARSATQATLVPSNLSLSQVPRAACPNTGTSDTPLSSFKNGRLCDIPLFACFNTLAPSRPHHASGEMAVSESDRENAQQARTLGQRETPGGPPAWSPWLVSFSCGQTGESQRLAPAEAGRGWTRCSGLDRCPGSRQG